jgi:hypothetical protein
LSCARSFALRYQGRKRVIHADDMLARITAERLIQHLTASGFVVMKGQPAAAPTTAHMPPVGRWARPCPRQAARSFQYNFVHGAC